MALLLTWAGGAEPTAPGPRTGGTPLVPAGFTWPTCATCSGAQQFLAQLPLDASEQDGATVLAFQCANDPGLCDEWDPESGGNAALVVDGPLAPAAVPDTGVTTLRAVSALSLVGAGGGYDEARRAHDEAHGGRTVVGQLGGEPAWVQGDETPDCPDCDAPTAFVAQLEEGHDPDARANFGGGCAYVFACRGCATGRFLWQC